MSLASWSPVRRVVVAAIFGLIVCSGAVQQVAASILPLPDPIPASWSDIEGAMIGNYGVTAAGFFNVNGFSRATFFESKLTGMNYVLPNTIPSPLTALKILNLGVNSAGQVTSHGALSITLPSAVGPYPIGALLLGDVDDIRFVATGKLQIGFNVTGGSAANDFGGVGGMAGILLDMSQVPGTGANATSFASAFSFGLMTTGAPADIVGRPVPEPVSFLVFAGLTMASVGLTHRCRES